MTPQSCLNGIEHSIAEIDDEIRTHIPEISKRQCTPRVMAEVDALLDQRNLVRQMGAAILEEFDGTTT